MAYLKTTVRQIFALNYSSSYPVSQIICWRRDISFKNFK